MSDQVCIFQRVTSTPDPAFDTLESWPCDGAVSLSILAVSSAPGSTATIRLACYAGEVPIGIVGPATFTASNSYDLCNQFSGNTPVPPQWDLYGVDSVRLKVDSISSGAWTLQATAVYPCYRATGAMPAQSSG